MRASSREPRQSLLRMKEKNWEFVDEPGNERGIYTDGGWIVKIDSRCENGIKKWQMNIYRKEGCREEYQDTIVEEETREKAVNLLESWLDNDPVIID